MLEAGRFPVEQTISAVITMDEAPAMLAQWSDNPASFTKIMIDVNR